MWRGHPPLHGENQDSAQANIRPPRRRRWIAETSGRVVAEAGSRFEPPGRRRCAPSPRLQLDWSVRVADPCRPVPTRAGPGVPTRRGGYTTCPRLRGVRGRFAATTLPVGLPFRLLLRLRRRRPLAGLLALSRRRLRALRRCSLGLHLARLLIRAFCPRRRSGCRVSAGALGCLPLGLGASRRLGLCVPRVGLLGRRRAVRPRAGCVGHRSAGGSR